MGRQKIGRNDPCPCGSGKKFKHCCMALDGAPTDDLFTRCSQTIAAVKLKLDDANKADIKRIRKDARKNFLHYTTDKQLKSEQESIFSDWLWFDLCDEENTFAAAYLGEHQDYMPQPLKECLLALSQSYLSVYEPIQIGENFLEIKDIFTASLHRVTLKESLDADLNEKPLLLMGRLVRFPEGEVFSGMVLAADNNDGQAAYLQQHINYLASVKGELDNTLLLKANAEILFGLFEHTLRKKLININDIRVLALHNADQRLAIQQWLELNGGMDYVHQQGDVQWYQDRQEGINKMIAVADDYVVCCCGNLSDLENWPELPGDVVSPPQHWQLVNSNFHRQPPPSEMASIWFNVLQEQETERWLHTSHRELDNKSPLEIIAEENGISRVVNMLDKFAAQLDQSSEETNLIAYMRERIESLR